MKKILFVLVVALFLMIGCSDKSTEPDNEAPGIPFNPVPADSLLNVSVNAGLSWSCIDSDGDELSYDVYFGTITDSFLVSTGQSDSTYIAGVMNYETTYYWKIVASDGEYETISPVWTFSTESEEIENQPPDLPSSPNPVDEAEDIIINPTLSWTCTDPESDSLTYDVYFGTSSNPPSVSSGQSNTSYDSGPLDFGTIYYWKIIADDGEYETEGDVWSFTTSEVGDHGEMVFVQGGTFEMGDHFNEGFSAELPVHEVTLSSFYIGQYEVTHTNYIEFLNSYGVSSNGSYNGIELIDMDNYNCAIDFNGSFYFGGSNYASNIECPVIEVTWYGGLVYCNWLSEQEDLTPCYDLSDSSCNFSADGYRLPTEAEWEYASRGGLNWTDNYRYSGTMDNLGDYGWYDSNSDSQTHEVGTKEYNQLGIYDMSGNVNEWCNDWYSLTYYCISPDNNPTGPDSGTYLIVRGGSWNSSADYCRVAYRSFGPGSSYNHVGFRVLRAVE